MKTKTVAIVLAAGKGSRMHMEIQKQYATLLGRPVITHTLDAFEESPVDEVILVVGEGEIPFAREEIVDRYGYQKVTHIVTGGKERYESVYCGLCAKEEGTSGVAADDSSRADSPEITYVLIHDGARAFITPELIGQCIRDVQRYDACVMAVPVKDTIKIVNEEQYSVSTPDRSVMWQMQTPQCFRLAEIREAYRQMLACGDRTMTDDAMVMEKYGNRRVKMTMGSYENIKLTTPGDFILGEAILKHMRRETEA